jgi:hypothetical protein
VRVPDEAGDGSAKVTLSFPERKVGAVVPATIHLPVVGGAADGG